MTHIPISYSRTSDYEQCPRKFQSKYVLKNYPDDSNNPAFAKGNRIHEHMETIGRSLLAGNGVPEGMCEEALNGVPMLKSVVENYDIIMFEQQLAVDFDMNRTSWFDNSKTYIRVIADLIAIRGNEALVLDWKSGKVRPYDDKETGQLHMSSAVIMSLWPQVKKVNNAYVFLEHRETIPKVFTQDKVPEMLAPFMDLYNTICTDTEWEPKKNRYCGWCKVPGCEYSQ